MEEDVEDILEREEEAISEGVKDKPTSEGEESEGEKDKPTSEGGKSEGEKDKPTSEGGKSEWEKDKPTSEGGKSEGEKDKPTNEGGKSEGEKEKPTMLASSAKHLATREAADKLYRRNAERMQLKYSKAKRKKVITFSPGDFVSVRIPRIDRTSTDFHRLPCVVAERKGSEFYLYRLRYVHRTSKTSF